MIERLFFEAQRPANIEVVTELRNLLKQVTESVIHNKKDRQRILLCLSEAITNLIVHTKSDINTFTIRFGRNTYDWWLEIIDSALPWNPVEYQPAYTINNFEPTEHGRGIPLIKNQCDEMAYTAGKAISDKENEPNCFRLNWHIDQHINKPEILIVEDDNALSRIYTAYLKDLYIVHNAEDGNAAIETLNKENISLIVSDINMPKMDGISLRKQLINSKKTESLPFIFLTSTEDHHIKNKASDLGIDDYLSKPVDKTKLIYTINRILHRSQQVCNHLTQRIDKHISSALKPELPETTHGWNLCVANRNTGSGGGDLLLHNNNDKNMTLAILDIMGHNDSAKFFSYAYGGYLRGLMQNSDSDGSTTELLKKLSEISSQDNLLSLTTLTACIANLSENGKLTLASAGHPQPLHITKTGISPVQIGGTLPGLLAETTYQAKDIQLKPGERIAIYTDGLFESATSNIERYELEKDIIKALTNSLSMPIKQSLEQVMQVFDDKTEKSPQDDTLLLLMEPC